MICVKYLYIIYKLKDVVLLGKKKKIILLGIIIFLILGISISIGSYRYIEAKKQAEIRLEEKAREEARKIEIAKEIAAEEARLKAEEEARLKAEEEARLKAEEEARIQAELAAKAAQSKPAVKETFKVPDLSNIGPPPIPPMDYPW